MSPELKPYEGRKSPEPYWRVFFRPFNLVQSPVLVWAALLYGTNAALYVVRFFCSSFAEFVRADRHCHPPRVSHNPSTSTTA